MVVSPINVIKTINVMLTMNVIKVSHKCNTHYKCNKLLTINVIRANLCKNRPKSPIRGKAQKIKIALLLQTGRH